jgi:hypothetical protein
LECDVDPIPIWKPRDYVEIENLPEWLDPEYVEAAKRLDEEIKRRERN